MDLFSEIEESREKAKKDKGADVLSVSVYLDKINSNLKSERAKIVGEVSGLHIHQSGHVYFSLLDKTDRSKIECIIWRNTYKIFGLEIVEGMEIIVTAYPEIYKPYGKLSLQVQSFELAGEGALQIAYEKLKAKLLAEGLFDESRKRAIPDFPHTIGVITSKSGAVINDFLSNIGKCGFEILFVDSKVEGADAVKDLLSAVKTLAKKKVDVLVMMRGGGSLESFQGFNNETLVRAVAEFPAPVITGIGHDKDEPLVSMVSDKNVSTPTAVANLLSAGFRDANLNLKNSEQRMISGFEEGLGQKMFYLQNAEQIMERGFRNIFDTFSKYFESLRRAGDKIQATITMTRNMLAVIEKTLEARNPERQLKLGWSIVRSKTGKVIRSVKDIHEKENFQISLADGTIDATKA